MSRELSIEVEGTPLERARADLVVIPLFADQRPLLGGAGRIDWRLCGQLSRLVTTGRIRGDAGEAALLVAFGGLLSPRLLVLGAGSREAFDAKAFTDLVASAARRAAGLHVERVALPLLPEFASRAGSVLGAAAGALVDAPDGSLLTLSLCVAREEVVRTVDLLRRGGTRGVPSDVAVRLPGSSSPAASRPRESPAEAPWGSQLVK